MGGVRGEVEGGEDEHDEHDHADDDLPELGLPLAELSGLLLLRLRLDGQVRLEVIVDLADEGAEQAPQLRYLEQARGADHGVQVALQAHQDCAQVDKLEQLGQAEQHASDDGAGAAAALLFLVPLEDLLQRVRGLLHHAAVGLRWLATK